MSLPPPMTEEQRQYLLSRAVNDLGQLAQFHKIFGVLCLFGMLCGLPHTFLGIAVATGAIPMEGKTTGDPVFGTMFALAGLAVIAGALILGLLNLQASKNLEQRTGRMLLTIVSALNLLAQPIGLALGIYTLIVLSRAEVRELLP